MSKKAKSGIRAFPEYEVWKTMRQRCRNPKHKQYPDYGARGIKVCGRWDSYDLFLDDMGRCPPKFSIERRDNNGDYCPQNCYWADRTTQNQNKRNNRSVSYKGEDLCVTELARRVGMSQSTLDRRIRAGIPAEKAVTDPVKPKKLYEIELDGKKVSLCEAARVLGIAQSSMSKWLVKDGLTIEEILEKRNV